METPLTETQRAEAERLLPVGREVARRMRRVIARGDPPPDPDEIEEAVAAAALAAARTPDNQGGPEGRLRFARVYITLSLRHWSAKRRAAQRRERPLPPDCPAPEGGPPSSPERVRAALLVAALLGRVTALERSVLTLSFGLGGGPPLSGREVAARLGVTAETAEVVKSAALAKLRGRPTP